MEFITWKCFEIIDLEQVVAVRVRGHEAELLLEVLIQRIAFVHHPDHKHLDVTLMSFCHCALQTDRVPLISLPVCDDDGHLPHTCPCLLEQLAGLLDGTARVRTLTYVDHGPHQRLDLITCGFLPEADYHSVDVAVEDHTDPRGVPADRGSIDQGIHKVFDHIEVFRADALRAVDHKNKL